MGTLSQISNRFETTQAVIADAGPIVAGDAGEVYRFARDNGIMLEIVDGVNLKTGLASGVSRGVLTKLVRDLLVANKTGLLKILRPTTPEELVAMKPIDVPAPASVTKDDWSRLLWLVDLFCRPDLADVGELRTAAGEWVSIPATVRELAAALGKPDRSNRPLAYSRLAWFHRLYNNDIDAGGAAGWRADNSMGGI